MPPKGTVNGFWLFTQSNRSKWKAQGLIVGSNEQLLAIANPLWKSMSQAEKKRWDARAREERKKRQEEDGDDELRDNTGNKIGMRRDPLEEVRRQRERDLSEITSQWHNKDLTEEKFYFVSFQDLCETTGKEWLPREVAVIQFCLRKGVTQTYHQFIWPGGIPLGYRFAAERKICKIIHYSGFNCSLQLQVIQPHAGCAPHSLYPTPTNLSSLFTLMNLLWFGKMATAAKNAAKRKSLSLKEKIDIIKKAEDNPALSTTSIGDSFGIARTAVASVLNNKVKYKQLFFQSETDVSRKRVRSAKFEFQPQLKATELLFLPPNFTSKTQPLDQGIVRNVKLHYRNAHLMQLVAHLDAGIPRKEFSINILQALTMLRDAWDQVLPETISNCFRKAGFTCTKSSSIEFADRPHDNIPLQPEPLLSRLFEEYNISPQAFFTVDDDVVTAKPYSPRKEAASTAATPADSTNSYSDDDSGEPQKPVSKKKLLDSMNCLNAFCMQNDVGDEIMKQVRMMTFSLQKHVARLGTQKTIPQFFKETPGTSKGRFEEHDQENWQWEEGGDGVSGQSEEGDGGSVQSEEGDGVSGQSEEGDGGSLRSEEGDGVSVRSEESDGGSGQSEGDGVSVRSEEGDGGSVWSEEGDGGSVQSEECDGGSGQSEGENEEKSEEGLGKSCWREETIEGEEERLEGKAQKRREKGWKPDNEKAGASKKRKLLEEKAGESGGVRECETEDGEDNNYICITAFHPPKEQAFAPTNQEWRAVQCKRLKFPILMIGSLRHRPHQSSLGEEEHKIPVEEMEEDSRDFGSICESVAQVLQESAVKGKYPPLYCLSKEQQKVQYLCDWLWHHSGKSSTGARNPMGRVHTLEDMVTQLFAFSGNPDVKNMATFQIADQLDGSQWDYFMSSACKFHMGVDVSRHCSLGVVRKYAYTVSDLLAAHYNVKLSESHVPVHDEKDVTLMKMPIRAPAKPRGPARGRGARNPADKEAFAGADGRGLSQRAQKPPRAWGERSDSNADDDDDDDDDDDRLSQKSQGMMRARRLPGAAGRVTPSAAAVLQGPVAGQFADQPTTGRASSESATKEDVTVLQVSNMSIYDTPSVWNGGRGRGVTPPGAAAVMAPVVCPPPGFATVNPAGGRGFTPEGPLKSTALIGRGSRSAMSSPVADPATLAIGRGAPVGRGLAPGGISGAQPSPGLAAGVSFGRGVKPSPGPAPGASFGRGVKPSPGLAPGVTSGLTSEVTSLSLAPQGVTFGRGRKPEGGEGGRGGVGVSCYSAAQQSEAGASSAAGRGLCLAAAPTTAPTTAPGSGRAGGGGGQAATSLSSANFATRQLYAHAANFQPAAADFPSEKADFLQEADFPSLSASRGGLGEGGRGVNPGGAARGVTVGRGLMPERGGRGCVPGKGGRLTGGDM
ncbi:hypothetical protein ACOMHN_054596 [Nucella lapillus]